MLRCQPSLTGGTPVFERSASFLKPVFSVRYGWYSEGGVRLASTIQWMDRAQIRQRIGAAAYWPRMAAKQALALGRSRVRPLGPPVPVRLSLTTYPARVDSARQALESILFGVRARPAAISLVLSVEEFPGRVVPDALRELEQDSRLRLEFLWVERTTKCYQKLAPTLEKYPQDTIVTADDDILYPARWLSDLVCVSRAHPGEVIGHRALRIRRASPRSLEPYLNWRAAEPGTPTELLFLTGVGGVLYPPGSLHPQVADMDLALTLTPTADDIWFHAMRLLSGVRATTTTRIPIDAPSTRRTGNKGGLWASNQLGGDDRQLKRVFDHFNLWRFGA
jgi:hypothetical protein